MTRPPLVCNCTRLVMREQEVRPVRGWRWDCPSCGLDKRRALVAASDSARARRILTLTFPQPRAQQPDGLPDIPPEFARCLWDTHVYRYRDGTWRWRVLSSCRHCSARVSKMLTEWRKRLRRRWSATEYLMVKEAHKSGALHLHVLVVGLPQVLLGTRPEGRAVRRAWNGLGGGNLHLGRLNVARNGAMQAGGYAAKYVTKAVGLATAPGYRRWSRTRGFGPEVRIPGPVRAVKSPNVVRPWVMVGGWLDPFSGQLSRERVWDSTGRDPVPLDTSTCNCPLPPRPGSPSGLTQAQVELV